MVVKTTRMAVITQGACGVREKVGGGQNPWNGSFSGADGRRQAHEGPEKEPSKVQGEPDCDVTEGSRRKEWLIVSHIATRPNKIKVFKMPITFDI